MDQRSGKLGSGAEHLLSHGVVRILKHVFMHELGEFFNRQILTPLHERELEKTDKPGHQQVKSIPPIGQIHNQSFLGHGLQQWSDSVFCPAGGPGQLFEGGFLEGKTGRDISLIIAEQDRQDPLQGIAVRQPYRVSVEGFNPRAFGDLITQWGTSTILVESGGWEDDPQKQHLRKVNFVALVAALDAIASGSYDGVGTDAYQGLPDNGRRVGDLVIRGGTIVIQGLPPFRADLLVNYGKPLLEEDGTIAEIGDLAEVEARDTLDLTGLFIHPRDRALERDGDRVQIKPGAPAYFSVSRREDGRDPLWTFRGGPPSELRLR